ncbi:hypothetical protein K438DRAFT_2023581 [Mycena galopus ATCC 62051]|nr:hypothetical protein K438DRAFT_2023581 [Mycena galopus ATCC 62051]
MYATTSAARSPRHPIPPLAFRNQCGRPGCLHIFEYDGPNPLGNIQRLVREHSPLCRGQRPQTTDIFWRRWEHALDSEAMDDMCDEYESVEQFRAGSSTPSSSGSTADDSQIDMRDQRSTSRSSSLGSVPSSSAFSVKKTARTEAERRRTLETDEWTLRVTPHEVVCRGCRRTIKLDRRSRYYPGLWEKHRDRCESVNKMRQAMEAESPIQSVAMAEPPIPSIGRVMDTTALPPRKSYYRNL